MQVDEPMVEATPSGQILPAAAADAGAGASRLLWLRRLFRNGKAVIGGALLGMFILMALLAPVIAPGDPNAFVDLPHQPPSAAHLLGTTGGGQDIFQQLVWGARLSLGVGFAAGLLMTLIAIVIGMTAGYAGGLVDEALSLFMNIFLIIPALPLLVVVAAFFKPGATTIILVLGLTGWAWGARVMRSQTLSLREKDFVSAALVSGESTLRIIFTEILPNMTSLVAANFFGATLYAILAEAGLEFLGLGDVSAVSWGTILYWAANNAGLLQNAWWTFIPAGLCIALVAFAFSMINYAMDEITNPRLRAIKESSSVLKRNSVRPTRATPVLRRAE